jgi:hypothetical protein
MSNRPFQPHTPPEHNVALVVAILAASTILMPREWATPAMGAVLGAFATLLYLTDTQR